MSLKLHSNTRVTSKFKNNSNKEIDLNLVLQMRMVATIEPKQNLKMKESTCKSQTTKYIKANGILYVYMNFNQKSKVIRRFQEIEIKSNDRRAWCFFLQPIKSA